jgi:TolA-binding protein
MRKTTIAFLAIAATFAVPAALSQGGNPVPPAPPPAAAVVPDGENRSITGDRRMDAIVFGLASVAVDSEANVIRINELEDRIAELEKRIKTLEGKLTGR